MFQINRFDSIILSDGVSVSSIIVNRHKHSYQRSHENKTNPTEYFPF